MKAYVITIKRGRTHEEVYVRGRNLRVAMEKFYKKYPVANVTNVWENRGALPEIIR